MRGGAQKRSGGVLLSHTEIRAVPSALRGLTTEFGMGSGMTLSLWPPEKSLCLQLTKSRRQEAASTDLVAQAGVVCEERFVTLADAFG